MVHLSRKEFEQLVMEALTDPPAITAPGSR